MNENLEYLKNQLKSCSYWCKKIIENNLEIEALEHAMYGITSKVNDVPSDNSDPYRTPTALIEHNSNEICRLAGLNAVYVSRINWCREELLKYDEELKYSLIQLCIYRRTMSDVASELNTSRNGLKYKLENFATWQ